MSKSTDPAPDRVELDDLLEEVGHFGPFQLWQCSLLLLPVIFTAFSNLCYVFTAGDLHYRCLVPECETASGTTPYAPEWLRAAVPFGGKPQHPAKCDRYQVIPSSPDEFVCDESRFNRSAIERCTEFVYADPSERTILNDFDLTCEENLWKVTLVGTVHSIGQFVSLALSGIISDRFGRRWTLLLCVGVGAVLAIVRSFAGSYPAFITLEFVEAMFGSTSYTTAFILSLELVEPRLRVIVKSIILVAYALAEGLLGLLAMTFRNWRTLTIVLFVPGVLSIPLLYTTVESVRWLLTKDRQSDVVNILQRVAKANGRPPLPKSTLDEFYLQQKTKLEAEQRDGGGKKSFFQLVRETCRHRSLLLRIGNCAFCWFTNAMVYYGLTLNSVTLAGDKYSNFIFITLAEIPPSLAINFILNRFGRRKTQCGSLILSGVFCLLALTALKDITWLNVSLFLMSKMAISLSFSTLYIYTAEIFPTNLRQSFISFCSMVGRFGSMLAPQMPLLQALWAPLPMVLFGSVAVLSGILILEFPETTGVTLPNTLEEAIELHSRRKRSTEDAEKGSYASPG
ncbi:solute carrier family 22 member 3-like [Anopheles stephensi]|uniref:Major facilitator superfamily (MFS) profile domain-containing protein n=1 Tax=Anopheles stephensi TaxID=30069 RepID=A0A182YHV4_ANOST|nr:solute carrier family 22 member 3-like [Anopheles stephensi]